MSILSVSRRPLVLGGLALLVVLAFALGSTPGKSYLLERSERNIQDNIKNGTLGFQQIFVINIEARTDHRDSSALAARLTGLNVTFFNAVTEVNSKAVPPGGGKNLPQGHLGAWRSHLSVARRMIEEDIQSALILEDDSDWDIRIHEQLAQFARASQLLLQPLPGTKNQFLDPTYNGVVDNTEGQDFYVGQHTVTKPTTSPYGDLDKWDMLWLGHCGATIPLGQDGTKTPLGRAVILNDQSTPERKHFDKEFSSPTFHDNYPDHARVVYRTGGNVCTLGYALSQQGARKMVYELGVRKLDAEIDSELDAWCRGKNDRPMATCLTASPQYFNHHRPAGNWASMSEINDMNFGENKVAFTKNLRWSAKVNIGKMVNGLTDYIDHYQDGQPRTDT